MIFTLHTALQFYSNEVNIFFQSLTCIDYDSYALHTESTPRMEIGQRARKSHHRTACSGGLSHTGSAFPDSGITHSEYQNRIRLRISKL